MYNIISLYFWFNKSVFFLSQFLESVMSMEHICYTNGKTIADFGFTDYGVLSLRQGDLTISVYKDHYNAFAKTNVEGQSATLQTTTNESINSGEDFFVVFCTTRKNPYWWLLDNVYQSGVVYIQYNNTPEMTFEEPYLISFETFDLNREDEVGDVFDNMFIYNGMVSYRVNVYSSYQVQFINLTDEYTILITEFVKPTLEELKTNGVDIDPKNSVLPQSYKKQYHSWHYINILMEEKTPSPCFIVATYGCYKWNKNLYKWDFACSATSNSTDKIITCECYSASILKAQRDYNGVQMETVIQFNFELELEPEFVIAIVLLLLLIVFYIIFVIINKTAKTNILDRNIVFVSDVPRYCRNAYLVIVETNQGFKDGTTSNIVIKIIGDKSSSKEHVLNYPDPQRKFLQRNNEDWFIVGTEDHLGDIKKIEIWFDSIGLFPNWSCKSFEIYDLQQDKYWYFRVQKLFSLEYMKNPKYEVKPSEGHGVQKEKKKKFGCKCQIRKRPHFWLFNTHKIAELSQTFRLVTVYSIIVTIMWLGLIWNGLPQFNKSDALNPRIYFNFEYDIFLMAIVSCCLTFLIHGPFVILYRKLNISERKNSRRYKRILIKTCWGFLIGNIIICNTAVLTFGMWISKVSSLVLLAATLGGILIYIFIFEYLMQLTYTHVSYRIQRLQFFTKLKDIILNFIETERAFLYRKFGRTGLRPYLVHLYEPLIEDELDNRQDWTKEKLSIIALVEDLIMYLLYIFLLYVVLMAGRHSSFIYNNRQLTTILQTPGYFKIFTLWQLNNYLRDDLLDVIQSATWYPHYTSMEPGLMSEKHNSYLGVMRFRQLRATNNNCDSKVLKLYPNCTSQPEYYVEEEIRNFSRRWKLKEINKFDRMYELWLYNSENLGSNVYHGQICSYGRGGYTASMGRNFLNSHMNIEYCIGTNWIDTRTRAMFVEFLSYNVHTNLFNSIELRFELGATGARFQRVEVYTAKLLLRDEEIGIIIVAIFVAFIAVVSILFLRTIIFIYQKRKSIFKKFYFWICIDLCVITFSVVCIWLHATKVVRVKEFLQELELRKLNEFVPYDRLFSAAWVFNCFAGLLICIATIRLWKLLRSLAIFHMMERTLVESMSPLCCLLCFHFIVLFGYSLIGYIGFGDRSRHFKTIPRTLMNLVLCSFGKQREFDLSVFSTIFDYAYYSSYMIICIIIYRLYITIIITHYKIVQIEFSNQQHYSLKQYIGNRISCFLELFQLKFLKGKKRVRGGAGQKSDQHSRTVTPKSDEHRYANVLTISDHKLLTMNLIAQSLIRKDKMSMTQMKCLSRLIWALHTTPTKQGRSLFYLDKLDPKKFNFVDDYKMLRMAHICEVLLDPERASHEGRIKHETAMFDKVMDKHLYQLQRLETYLNKVSGLIKGLQSKLDADEME